LSLTSARSSGQCDDFDNPAADPAIEDTHHHAGSNPSTRHSRSCAGSAACPICSSLPHPDAAVVQNQVVPDDGDQRLMILSGGTSGWPIRPRYRAEVQRRGHGVVPQHFHNVHTFEFVVQTFESSARRTWSTSNTCGSRALGDRSICRTTEAYARCSRSRLDGMTEGYERLDALLSSRSPGRGRCPIEHVYPRRRIPHLAPSIDVAQTWLSSNTGNDVVPRVVTSPPVRVRGQRCAGLHPSM
jgi:hypothetical protein